MLKKIIKATIARNSFLTKYLKTIPLVGTLRQRYFASKGAYLEVAACIDAQCGGLNGKRVLELGCSWDGDFIGDIDRNYSVAEAVGINLALSGVSGVKQLSPTLRLQVGDIRKMEFDENYFDLLISSSVFEHLQDFDQALLEMHRVLKPGGFVYSHFGPIWSGSYGHHLWLSGKAKTYTYHNIILPPFCQLLMTEDAVAERLRKGGQPEGDAIAHYVFQSPDQNHLMFSDYERLFRSSPFEVMYLKGYDYPQLQQIYARSLSSQDIELLNQRYPDDRDRFLFDGITVLLRKH